MFKPKVMAANAQGSMRPVNRFPYKFIGTKMAQKWLEIVILWQKNVSNDLKNWHLVYLGVFIFILKIWEIFTGKLADFW